MACSSIVSRLVRSALSRRTDCARALRLPFARPAAWASPSDQGALLMAGLSATVTNVRLPQRLDSGIPLHGRNGVVGEVVRERPVRLPGLGQDEFHGEVGWGALRLRLAVGGGAPVVFEGFKQHPQAGAAEVPVDSLRECWVADRLLVGVE